VLRIDRLSLWSHLVARPATDDLLFQLSLTGEAEFGIGDGIQPFVGDFGIALLTVAIVATVDTAQGSLHPLLLALYLSPLLLLYQVVLDCDRHPCQHALDAEPL